MSTITNSDIQEWQFIQKLTAQAEKAEKGDGYAELGAFALGELMDGGVYGKRSVDIFFDESQYNMRSEKRNAEMTVKVQRAMNYASSENEEVAAAGKELLSMFAKQKLFGKRVGEVEKFGLEIE